MKKIKLDKDNENDKDDENEENEEERFKSLNFFDRIQHLNIHIKYLVMLEFPSYIAIIQSIEKIQNVFSDFKFDVGSNDLNLSKPSDLYVSNIRQHFKTPQKTYKNIEFDILDYENVTLGWRKFMQLEFQKDYSVKLAKRIRDDINRFDDDDDINIFPPINQIFNAFELTPLENVKVVIIGMDPYIRPNQAMGLSFSVNDNIKVPPSLMNIYKELERDPKIEFKKPKSGNLTRWTKQGVFLLNAALTVREGKSDSHSKFGWSNFTSSALKLISQSKKHVVFMLWGRNAQSIVTEDVVDLKKHVVLCAGHPSPMNRNNPFVGCGHFSKANEWLESKGERQIDWSLN